MVKELDQILLATEGKQLMSFDGWGNLPYPPDDRIKIDEIRPQLVEKAFLAKYWKYQKGVATNGTPHAL